MVGNDVIIEVKTSWIEKDGKYERDIIEYRYDNDSFLDNVAYSIKYLSESVIGKEISEKINKNTFEIGLKSNNLQELNDLEKFLLRYVKNKWELY